MTKTDYAREEHHEFLDAAAEAIANENLQDILTRLGDSLGTRNREAWDNFEPHDQVRLRARAIKDATLADLGTHLETLEASVQKLGGHVHWADDGSEACRTIVDIINSHDATKVVKSKSMTGEEIHLNAALEAADIEAVETDLGEYIIQVAGQRPSHLVGPALHLSAKDVAEVLSKPAGRELPVDSEQLTAFAREKLRSKFAEAEIGISGANYAIAETGTIVLISNEGNARLTTSLPKVHIAIMGIEKVIPKLDDLPPFLKVLARAATGQKLSIYTSLITGPRQDGEIDGPEEFHLIILDNGRTKILESPLRESLFCIRCGACLNACPVYRTVGGHSYGGVYAGPIGSILTPLYDGLSENHHLPHACSLCGACQQACPVKIALPDMLVQLRDDLHNEPGQVGWLESLAYKNWARSLRSPWMYGWATWLATRIVGRWKKKNPWIRRLPGGLSGWTEKRDFPAPSHRRFRDWWEEEGQNES